ncbi:MAG TPA: hypothetical protein VFX85_12675 [Solirubrobacterales bacterium]|nr:hypothetical protein [Solirubrobacterales bacterium]
MRTLKVLGLALVAALTIGSTAAADELTAETYPVAISGVSEERGFVFTSQAGQTFCYEGSYAATSSGPSTSLTVTPTYPEKTKSGGVNCGLKGVPGAVVDLNGCDYLLTISGAGSTSGTARIHCPAGSEITYTASLFGIPGCTIHVPDQTFPPGSVTYANVGAGTTREVTASVNSGASVKYTQTPGMGAAKCTAWIGENGSLTAKMILKATQESTGSHAGLFLSGS